MSRRGEARRPLSAEKTRLQEERAPRARPGLRTAPTRQTGLFISESGGMGSTPSGAEGKGAFLERVPSRAKHAATGPGAGKRNPRAGLKSACPHVNHGYTRGWRRSVQFLHCAPKRKINFRQKAKFSYRNGNILHFMSIYGNVNKQKHHPLWMRRTRSKRPQGCFALGAVIKISERNVKTCSVRNA